MRESLLDESLSPTTKRLEPGKTLQVERRQFLQTLGVVGVGLALWPGAASARAANAGVWRDRVTGFVYTVCNERRAQAINARLFRATLEYAPPPRTFHSYYAAPFIFVETIDPEEVMCGNGFQVNQFPLYDVRCPCSGMNDLNSHEINRITNKKEMDYYKCVLAPTSRRRQPDVNDHANYREVIKSYPYDHRNFNLEYVRDFEGQDETHPGYYITHKTQKGANGKPLGDMLLA